MSLAVKHEAADEEAPSTSVVDARRTARVLARGGPSFRFALAYDHLFGNGERKVLHAGHTARPVVGIRHYNPLCKSESWKALPSLDHSRAL